MACDIGLSWLLIGIVIFFPGTFVVTYVISVMLGHVHPAFPYISDTGTMPPESCVFAQMLNIGSVIVAMTMYVRYRQLGDHIDALQRRHVVVNKLSLIVGLMSAFGASVVANFQVSNVVIVHLIGAFLTFVVGMVYAWLQVILSFNTCPQLSSRRMCHIRLTVTIFASVTLLLTFIFAGVAKKIESRGFYDEMWLWQLCTVSTVFEWVLAVCNVVYFLTFFGEFRRVCINLPLLRTIKSSSPAVELNGILLA